MHDINKSEPTYLGAHDDYIYQDRDFDIFNNEFDTDTSHSRLAEYFVGGVILVLVGLEFLPF